VALNPGTPLHSVQEVVGVLDLLLVMTVNPGFGGQKFLDYCVDKVSRARVLLDGARSGAALEVDGGIARDTIKRVFDAGANTFVAGHAIFSARNPKAEIAALRASCADRA
jgi:ribulose-phosphate 3-epimerase